MSGYQGKALHERGKRARKVSPLERPLRVTAAMLATGVIAMLPWGELRARFLVLERIHVTGARYLDPARVRARSGLERGEDLLEIDLERARQRVLLEPRVMAAHVRRVGLRSVEIHVEERVPALAVEHGEPWELDEHGVLLEPLEAGVVADVPMLAGPDFSGYRAGSQLRTPEVRRGLAWTAVLSDNALRLIGQVSEVDVSDPRLTRLVLLNGIRVIAPVWPNGARQLSGLRATLADLAAKGLTPREVDVRFKEQIVVRGARPDGATAATPPIRDS
jgi:cell division septal protein FtsQ